MTAHHLLERILRAPHGGHGSASAPKKPRDGLGATEDQHMRKEEEKTKKRPPSSTAPTTGRGAPPQANASRPRSAAQKRNGPRGPKRSSRRRLPPRGYWQWRIRPSVYRGPKRDWRRCLWVRPPRRAKPSELHRVRIATGRCYRGVRLGAKRGVSLCDPGPGTGERPPLISL